MQTFSNSFTHIFFCRALVFVCHGFAEHYGWYDSLAEALTKRGLLVFSHDHGPCLLNKLCNLVKELSNMKILLVAENNYIVKKFNLSAPENAKSVSWDECPINNKIVLNLSLLDLFCKSG